MASIFQATGTSAVREGNTSPPARSEQASNAMDLLSARLAALEDKVMSESAARARLEGEVAAAGAEVARLRAELEKREQDMRRREREEAERRDHDSLPAALLGGEERGGVAVRVLPGRKDETVEEAYARAMKMRKDGDMSNPVLAAVVKLLQRLSGGGHVKSMIALAGMYFAGKVAKAGTLRMHKRAALLWWEKVLMVEPENTEALCRKGEALFQFSDSTSPDLLQQAYDLFDKAASLGSPEGNFLKGRWLVVMAPSHLDAKRAEMGKKLVEEAAEAGVAKAHVFLGHCYEFPHNYEPAVFDSPAESHEREMYILSLYKRAAELNDPDGLNDIGSCYATGYGDLKKDFDKAVEFYVRAIKAGSLDAFDNLGTHYETGMNAARNDLIDFDKALHYYRQGAFRKCPKCVLNLGIAYEEGMTREDGTTVLDRSSDMAEKLFRHAIALADDLNDKGTKTRAHKDLAALYITRRKLARRGSSAAALNVRKLRAMMIDSVYQATLDDVNSALCTALRGHPKLLEQMLGEHNAVAVVAHAKTLLAQAKVGSDGAALHPDAAAAAADAAAADKPGAADSISAALAEIADLLGSVPEDLTGVRVNSKGRAKRGSANGTAIDQRRVPKRGRTK